ITGQGQTVTLLNTGQELWTGRAPATVGSVLRYKYIRPLPKRVDETTVAQQPVRYRLFAVSAGENTAADVVAGWADLPFAGPTGGLDGRVWNGASGQGVMGILVAAGGQQTLTAHDGTFSFQNIPTGAQRATLMAPDGSLLPAQQVVPVAAGRSAPVDLVRVDPEAVHLTFLVQPPP